MKKIRKFEMFKWEFYDLDYGRMEILLRNDGLGEGQEDFVLAPLLRKLVCEAHDPATMFGIAKLSSLTVLKVCNVVRSNALAVSELLCCHQIQSVGPWFQPGRCQRCQ